MSENVMSVKLKALSLLTCIGVLSDAKEVKPTMSVNIIVTQVKFSASTGCPSFNCIATDLGNIL